MFDENYFKLILNKSQDGKRALIAFKNGNEFQYVIGELPEEYMDAQPGDCIILVFRSLLSSKAVYVRRNSA